jgi:hypothetical protein
MIGCDVAHIINDFLLMCMPMTIVLSLIKTVLQLTIDLATLSPISYRGLICLLDLVGSTTYSITFSNETT